MCPERSLTTRSPSAPSKSPPVAIFMRTEARFARTPAMSSRGSSRACRFRPSCHGLNTSRRVVSVRVPPPRLSPSPCHAGHSASTSSVCALGVGSVRLLPHCQHLLRLSWFSAVHLGQSILRSPFADGRVPTLGHHQLVTCLCMTTIIGRGSAGEPRRAPSGSSCAQSDCAP